MNDLPTSPTPWLRTRDHFDRLADDQGSRVILTHPAADGGAVSLGRALRWALEGDTRSFNAVVGYFHQSAPADGDNDDETDRRLIDDPASIIIDEGREGFITGSGPEASADSVGFRLLAGQLCSRAAEAAIRTWYWLCRWRALEPDQTDDIRSAFLDRVERDGFRTAALALLPSDGADGPLSLIEWSLDDARDRLELVDGEETAWDRYKRGLEKADDDDRAAAGILLGFFLQRQADIRMAPAEFGVDQDDQPARIAQFHPKLYVVERADHEDTFAFVGSNNWSSAGFGPGSDDSRIPRSNVEVSTAHATAGAAWSDDLNSAPSINELATDVTQTTRHLFGQGLVIGAWTDAEPGEWMSADEAMEMTAHEPVHRIEPPEPEPGETTPPEPTDFEKKVASLLQDLVSATLGIHEISRLDDQAIFEDESTFGGLVPQQYQLDGATRLNAALSGDNDGPGERGVFLTDEAGLGKTLIAKMVATTRLAEILIDRAFDRSTDPVRFTAVAPARLLGQGPDSARDISTNDPTGDGTDASGWKKHCMEITGAVREAVARRLPKRFDDRLDDVMGLLEWRVLSISSFSRRLEADDDLDPEVAYERPDEQIELRDEVLDDLFHVAASELVIVDESHNFRNPDSRGTRTFRFCTSLPAPGEDWTLEPELGVGDTTASDADTEEDQPADDAFRAASRSRKLLCLSATPFNNRLQDLVTQIGHFARHQDWELALESRLADYTSGAQFLDPDSHPLTAALHTWQKTRRQDETRVAPDSEELQSAFGTLLKFSHQHFNSGRRLDVDSQTAEERLQEAGRRHARERVSDRGPDYDWSGQYENELTHVFSVAGRWFDFAQSEDTDLDEIQWEALTEDVQAARNRIDALLNRLVVQRSRARVLRIASATRGEDIETMFRKPRVPRHPLPLNDPTANTQSELEELDAATSFERRVLGTLYRILAAKTAQPDDETSEPGDEQAEPAGDALSLFPYEVSVRRGRAGQSGSADQTVRNTYGFQLVNLIKRLQSSPYAFLRTLLRGPLRKALFELALIERGFHDQNRDEWSDPNGWSEALDDVQPILGLYTTMLSRGSTEKVESVAGILGGQLAPEGDERFFRRLIGVDESSALRRKLDDAYEDLLAVVNPEDGVPTDDTWLEVLLEDLQESTSAQVWHDIDVALDWTFGFGDAFDDQAVLFDNLYEGFSTAHPVALRRDDAGEFVTYNWYGRKFPEIRQKARLAEEASAHEELTGWLNSRFEQDGRVLTLTSWLLIQAAVRQHGDDVRGPDGERPNLHGGHRTLIFSEYTDTQEYLLAILTALVRVLRQNVWHGPALGELKATLLEAMRHTAGNLDGRSADIRGESEELDDDAFSDPGAYQSPVSVAWIDAWLDQCREAEFTPLAELAGDLRRSTARICSDTSDYLFPADAEEPTPDAPEPADDDAIHEARADHDADVTKNAAQSTTVADDVILDAFSPWYQVGPSADPEAEELAEAAARLTKAADRPVHTLFATEVLAEGVNLQECGTVIHYDLPWNPTHLIQRNGRVDRRIFDRYENPDKRSIIEQNLADQFEPADDGPSGFRAPDFTRPSQVFHMTVVPVEPALDDEGRQRADRVRRILFSKLQTIRALFGLSAWPVVLGADDAGRVLDGEHDYETPGFRRREDLFAAWRVLDEKAGGNTANKSWSGDVDNLTFDVPARFRNQLYEAVTHDDLPDDSNWHRMAVAAIGTWTPEYDHSVPCHSGLEFEVAGEQDPDAGVISGLFFLGNTQINDREQLHDLIGWQFVKPTRRGRFYPMRYDAQSRPSRCALLNFEEPETSSTSTEPVPDDVAPSSPTALAEDILVELVGLLGTEDIEAIADLDPYRPVPSRIKRAADQRLQEWPGFLNRPYNPSAPSPPVGLDRSRLIDHNLLHLWVFVEGPRGEVE